jgi:ubiquinone/menaquinone biosynthesis C-methylase UbiE
MEHESLITRVLEPEVMDSESDAVDYDTMDHSEVNRKFVADFLAQSPNLREVLDLGTGTAQIPIELCQEAVGARVVAVDAAAHMLRLAEVNLACAGLTDRVQLVWCDAKTLPWPQGRFSAVMSNSIVHHIPEPRSVLAEAVRTAEPGALIFIRDLMRPCDDAMVRQFVDSYAAGANDHQRQLFGDSLRAALSLTEIRALVRELGFDPADVQPTSDRHWTWASRRLFPDELLK